MERGERRAGRRDGDPGSSAVEFALIMPVLILLLFGIIQFGILFAQDLAISNGAQQGVRAAAVPGNDCAVIVRLAEEAAGTIMLSPDDPELEVLVYRSNATGGEGVCPDGVGPEPCATQPLGTTVQVQVQRNAALHIPTAINRNLQLAAQASLQCEFS